MQSTWEKSRWIESKYQGQVTRITREINRIIGGYDTSTEQGRTRLQAALNAYADLLEPWVLIEAKSVFDKLNRQDLTLWMRQSKEIGRGLRDLVNNTQTGEMMRDFVTRQVRLIKSLPIDAGLRVHEISREAMMAGTRPEAIRAQISELGEITTSRAKCIARTECSRASSALTQHRGLSIGATHAIWRTSKDRAVRESHRHMEGKVYSLTEMPTLDDGTQCFPGQIYNCRCLPEIIIPGLK